MQFEPTIKIIRLDNCLFTFACVFFSAVYTGFCPKTLSVFALSLSAFFIAASGYIVNDIFDLNIDKINRPDRVLPAGLLSIYEAKLLSIIFSILGIVLSLSTHNKWHLIIASINLLLLLSYAAFFKKTLLVGNLIVAWSAASSFLYGALLSTNPTKIMPVFTFAFLYTILREWTKTIEDYDGDLAEHANTIAVFAGKKKTALLATIPSALIIICIFIFYFLHLINGLLFLLLHLLVSIPVIFLQILLIKTQHKSFVNKIHNWMKLDMLVLLLIFVFIHFYNIWS